MTGHARDHQPDALPAVEPAVEHLQFGLGRLELEEAEGGNEVTATVAGSKLGL